MAPTCIACGKPHAWGLISDEYAEICGDCVRDDPRVDFDSETGQYAIHAYCPCGARGPVNYGEHTDLRYYCGSYLSCCRP